MCQASGQVFILFLSLFFTSKISPRASPGSFPQGARGLLPVQSGLQAGGQLLRGIRKYGVLLPLAIVHFQCGPSPTILTLEMSRVFWGILSLKVKKGRLSSTLLITKYGLDTLL